MERDQASKFINDLLKLMVARKGSDLFITAEFPPAIKVDGKVTRLMDQPLVPTHTLMLARSIMSDKQVAEFERTKECNFAISPAGIGRFRVNAFIQQGRVGMVLRTIPADIPTIDGMGLPQVLKEVAMTKRGLCIFVGATGSGKSTVSKLLVERGAVLVDSDVIAREVVEPGEPALEQIRERFGERVFGPDGALDRPALGRVVFGDPAALRDELLARLRALRRAFRAEGRSAAM